MGELLWCKGSKLKIAFWKQLLQKFWQISKQKSVAKAFLSKIVGVTPAILLIVGFVIFNSRRLFQQQLSLQYIWTATVLVNRPLSTLKSIQVIIYEFFKLLWECADLASRWITNLQLLVGLDLVQYRGSFQYHRSILKQH